MVYGKDDINSEACVTGKHISRGGIQGNIEAKGLGAYYGIRNMLQNDEFTKKSNLSSGIEGKTFIIQGFTRIGKWVSHFLSKDGGIITAIITPSAAIYDSKGIDVAKAAQWYREHGGLAEYPDFEMKETINPNAFLELECDVLVPAAAECSINMHNAPNLKCKVIAEASNCPVTVMGEKIAHDKKIVILPDILLNAGGEAVGYFEWLKNIQHVEQGKLTRRWEEYSNKKMYESVKKEKFTDAQFRKMSNEHDLHGANEIDIVRTGLEEVICTSFDESWVKAQNLDTSIRMASLSGAIELVAGSHKESGIVF